MNELIQKELAEIEEMVEASKRQEEYKEKVFYIREGMLMLVGRNPKKVMLLNLLMGWTEHWLKTDNEIYKQIQLAAQVEDIEKIRRLKKQIRQGWFYKSFEDMSNELCKVISKSSAERYCEEFEEMGFIKSKQCEEKATYRANWYFANIDKIREELNELGYDLDHYKNKKATSQNGKRENEGVLKNEDSENHKNSTSQNGKPSPQNGKPSPQNGKLLSYIPTITTTSFTTNTSKYVGSSRLPVVDKYAENYKLTSYAEQNLTEMIKLHGESLVGAALDRAIKAETGKPIAYIEGVIRKWCVAGVSTVEEIEAYEKRFRDSKQKKTKKKADPNKMMDQLPRSVAAQMEQPAPEQQEQSDDLEEKQRRVQEKLKRMNEQLEKRKSAFEGQ